MNHGLVIIVPAWKAKFLFDALTSIKNQTCQDFSVLIVDDQSPDGIADIARMFPGYSYHRFEENLGGKDLVQHFNRCVRLVEADYYWIFSDDDIMSERCVDEFWKVAEKFPSAKVFQLPVRMMDDTLRTTFWQSTPPTFESSEEFLAARLRGERLSCMPDHIFSAEAFHACGGLTDFPLAWNADDASWALFGKVSGLAGVENCEVLWRNGSSNISGSSRNRDEKLIADLQFSAWITGEFPSLRKSGTQRKWLARRIARLYDYGAREIVSLCAPQVGIPLEIAFAALGVRAKDRLRGSLIRIRRNS